MGIVGRLVGLRDAEAPDERGGCRLSGKKISEAIAEDQHGSLEFVTSEDRDSLDRNEVDEIGDDFSCTLVVLLSLLVVLANVDDSLVTLNINSQWLLFPASRSSSLQHDWDWSVGLEGVCCWGFLLGRLVEANENVMDASWIHESND